MEYNIRQLDMNSVDLTEDEDSRGSVVGSEMGNPKTNYNRQNKTFPMSLNLPPPLTPIPRFDSLPIPQDHMIYSVPKLTKIQKKTSAQLSSSRKVKVISSTVIKPAIDTVSSGDVDSKVIPNESVSQVSIVSCSVSQNPPGKVLKIMKNNKTYEYVIPLNVMPNANQSSGPVLINIPEVGSIVISIDPQAKSQVVPKNVQLKPFSLNFDEIIEASDGSFNSPFTSPAGMTFSNGTSLPCSCCAGTKKVHMGNKTNCTKASSHHLEDLLTDKRFCWQYSKKKRREQRVLKNLLGFSKVELRNTKKCSRELDFLIYKKHCQLQMKKVMLWNLKTASSGINHQMLSDSVKKHGTGNHVCEPLPKTDHHQDISPADDALLQTKNFDDLLVTKKVVILNGENLEIPEKIVNPSSANTRRRNHKLKQRKEIENLSGNTMKKKKIVIKPCYISMTRSPRIDKMYIDLTRGVNSHKQISDTSKPSRIMMSYEKMFLSKLIDTVHKFREELAFIKPILVLNEFNFTMVKYSVEYSRSNIVLPVNKERYFPNCLLHDHTFVSAVETGYVKIVDADILCSYFRGDFSIQHPVRLD